MSFKHLLASYDPSIRNDLKHRAEHGIFPAYLLADDIAELWGEGTEFSKEAYLRLIKEKIEDGELACMTKEQWITLAEKKRLRHKRPPKITPQPNVENLLCLILPDPEVSLYATKDTDLVPQDRVGGYLGETSEMSGHEKKMAARLYMVNRSEFKKWLQNNDQWPLPEECLLARWWDSDEGDEEADALQAAATKQQKKAIQVLIERVLQANPEASNVEIWNKLKEYDTDENNRIILTQDPELLTKGNKDVIIEYRNPVTEKIYNPLKFKAFQERCTRARKELRLNSKS